MDFTFVHVIIFVLSYTDRAVHYGAQNWPFLFIYNVQKWIKMKFRTNHHLFNWVCKRFGRLWFGGTLFATKRRQDRVEFIVTCSISISFRLASRIWGINIQREICECEFSKNNRLTKEKYTSNSTRVFSQVISRDQSRKKAANFWRWGKFWDDHVVMVGFKLLQSHYVEMWITNHSIWTGLFTYPTREIWKFSYQAVTEGCSQKQFGGTMCFTAISWKFYLKLRRPIDALVDILLQSVWQLLSFKSLALIWTGILCHKEPTWIDIVDNV